jgi:membrane associated rhomboid family serine protease
MSRFVVALRGAVLLLAVVALLAVHRLDGDRGAELRARIRARFLLGVPWGTLVAVALVLAVYLGVQGGWDNPYGPLTLPFYSWSYLYPTGMLLAPFAHGGLGHLTGNLLGTLALAPLAEYAWSHYPTERGRASFDSPRTNPYVRAFVLFPLGVVVAGLLTSFLSWGALIGFSGVVFAFAGFALVRYPLGTVVALAVREVLSTAYYTFRNPVLTATARPAFDTPWWVDVAVQGHLLGLLLGALAAVVVLRGRNRRERPSAARLLVGSIILATDLALWALWWYGPGPDTYVLYRGVGLLLVVALAVLLVVSVHAPARRLWRGTLDLDLRTAGVLLLALPLLVMAVVAVPFNLTVVDDVGAEVEGGTQVRGYSVTYAEGVTNPKAAVLNVSVLGASTAFRTGGVIVANPDRELWTRQVSPGELAFTGTRPVRVGGLGWEEVVFAQRRGWVVRGGGPVYQVRTRPRGGEWRPVFRSDPATANVTLAGRNVTLAPSNRSAGGFRGFQIVVRGDNRTLGRTRLPIGNGSVRAGGLRFELRGTTLVALHDRTRVPVANRETYQ